MHRTYTHACTYTKHTYKFASTQTLVFAQYWREPQPDSPKYGICKSVNLLYTAEQCRQTEKKTKCCHLR